jgi:hypothetical protein
MAETAMSGGGGPPKSSLNIVRRVNLDEATVKKIAAALNLSDADVAQGISGVIYIGDASAPAAPIAPAAPTKSRRTKKK